MIGVTINNGGYYENLCSIAVKRFKKYTGIKTVVIIDTDIKERGCSFYTKLRLHTMFPNSSFVFFDSDLWFVKEIDLNQYDNSDKFYAVKDIGRNSPADFPINDCNVLGINSEEYFNSGFFIANGRNQKHRDAFEHACKLWGVIKLDDFGEQSFLNAGIQRNHVDVSYLSEELNYPIICDQFKMIYKVHEFSDSPYAIHALGHKASEKELMLNKFINDKKDNREVSDEYLRKHSYQYSLNK